MDILQGNLEDLDRGLQLPEILLQSAKHSGRQDKAVKCSPLSELVIITLNFMQKGESGVDKTFKSFNQRFDSMDIHDEFLREKENHHRCINVDFGKKEKIENFLFLQFCIFLRYAS